MRKTARISLAVISAAAVIFSGTACSALENSSTASSQVTVTETPETNVLPVETTTATTTKKVRDQYGMLNADQKAQVFRSVLEDGGITTEPGVTWSDYISLARDACSALDRNASLEEVMGVLVDGPLFTTETASTFLGAAIVIYCPKHEDLI